jgi:hypothetical protein
VRARFIGNASCPERTVAIYLDKDSRALTSRIVNCLKTLLNERLGRGSTGTKFSGEVCQCFHEDSEGIEKTV